MTVFFVHLPKTAGTSFRVGAEQFLGKDRVVYDYGDVSPETSELCREFSYARNDVWAFSRACADQNVAMVAGHVNVSRYIPALGIANTFAFLREPLQRIVSEYHHFVRHHGFKGSFKDYYANPRTHNKMSKMLRGVPIEAFGMLGLTERYKESLQMINALFGWRIPERADNTASRTKTRQYVLDPEDETSLKRLHSDDIELYRRCSDLFNGRWHLFQEGKSYVHGQITEAVSQKVSGWAWQTVQCDEPVELELLVNGVAANKALALAHRHQIGRFSPPRGGYVGFQFSGVAQPGDSVQCRVTATGQLFPDKPLQIVVPA